MELSPKLRRELAVIGACLGVAALSGCGTEVKDNRSPAPKGEFQSSKYCYPDCQDGKRVEIRCQGDALLVQRVASVEVDDKTLYTQDKLCENGGVTSADNQLELLALGAKAIINSLR
jgi:hypothetical protein